MDKSATLKDAREISAPRTVQRSGPPNRMNDLCYSDWMKFQKSFFKKKSKPELIAECIEFFTKSSWKEGQKSKSLIVGVPAFKIGVVKSPRIVHAAPDVKTFSLLEKYLTEAAKSETKYDFVYIDFSHLFHERKDIDEFTQDRSRTIFRLLRQSLNPGRYCAFYVDDSIPTLGGFPLAWTIAYACREFLRLRDEKIEIGDDLIPANYLLFAQADFDARSAKYFNASDVAVAKSADKLNIPAWVMPRSPRRSSTEIQHPAKFPESLVKSFIPIFTKEQDWVLDPMVGIGSTLLAANELGRNSVGIELSDKFFKFAQLRLKMEGTSKCIAQVLHDDARNIDKNSNLKAKKFDYVISSPPYWSMLQNKGSENQRKRREGNLPLVYSKSDERDLGNVESYDEFLQQLIGIYLKTAKVIKSGGHLTLIVKNVKRNHTLYPLGWDLVYELCRKGGSFQYVGNTFWCQDDIGMKPFAVGTHWVSNIVHQYCVHLKKV